MPNAIFTKHQSGGNSGSNPAGAPFGSWSNPGGAIIWIDVTGY